jgi:crossover junction endodeoxyribonuclease RuvC
VCKNLKPDDWLFYEFSKIMKQNQKVILGIDPGTVLFGYGVLKISGKKLSLISLGTVELHKLSSQQQKLERIFERVCWLIETYQPDDCAIEAPFYGKNPQSMLKLGRAQGVAMAAALTNKIDITEYSPKKVKQSITGNGNASKEQVAAMLQRLLNFNDLQKYLDATDALGVAVCHYFQSASPLLNNSKAKNWKDFLKQHPEKIMKS